MLTAPKYLARTASAVRQLFAGIEHYMSMLRQGTGPTFVTGELKSPGQDAEFIAWRQANAERMAAAHVAEGEFLAEVFALDTLCGAVLQVADKAIEMFGASASVPHGLPQSVGPHLAKFCVGRVVRGVPLGLVIYAARNQHTHFEGKLREPSATIFQLLATSEFDPAFDLNNKQVISFASNVTSLIGWRTYDAYEADLRAMLQA